MKISFIPTALPLVFLAKLSIAQDSSALFSQYIGATTATATFSGPDAPIQSIAFTACTNYLHGLAAIPLDLPATALGPIIQVQVDGVCEVCKSVEQTRIDSCCAVATSVNCFGQFKDGGPKTTPASNSATTTPVSNPATVTGSAPSPTSSSGGEKVDVVRARLIIIKQYST